MNWSLGYSIGTRVARQRLGFQGKVWVEDKVLRVTGYFGQVEEELGRRQVRK